MKRIMQWVHAVTMIICCASVFTACSKDDDTPVVPPDDKPIVLNCEKPDYLKAGDKVALISPSYFTPMENVEKTVDVLRSWGLEAVIGPNVGKVVDGRYGGTVAERVSDIRWALSDPSIKAIICNRGSYGTIQPIDVRADGASLQFNIDGDQQQVNTADITGPATPAAIRMQLAGKIE